MSFVHLHVHTEIQPAGRRLPYPRPGRPGEGAGAECGGRHRPRGDVRRGGLLPGLQGRGGQAHHRLRGVRGAPGHDRPGPRAGRRGPPPGAPVQERDRLPQSVLSGVPCLSGRVLYQAPHRQGAPLAAYRGAHCHVRLSGGRGAPAHHGQQLRGGQAGCPWR